MGGVQTQNVLHSLSIHDEMVQASPWGDALQPKDSDAPILSRALGAANLASYGGVCNPWELPGGPGGSLGGLRGSGHTAGICHRGMFLGHGQICFPASKY